MNTEDDQTAKIDYMADESPPLFITLLQGLSHLSLYPVAYAFPVMLVQSAGVSVADAISLSQITFLTMGIATILMTLKPEILGSGYLCPATACPSFFTASLLAAKSGGLGLLSGMLIFTGIFQAVFAKAISRVKFLLEPEIMGVVVLMIGMTALSITAPIFAGRPQAGIPFDLKSFLIGLSTFLIMLIPVIRKNNFWRRYSVLAGVVFGISASYILHISNPMINPPDNLAWFSFPPVGSFGWSFQVSLIPVFIIAGIASVLKTAACISACREINGESTDDSSLDTIGGGMLSVGLSNIISGLAGGMGNSAAAGNIGLSFATGISSRRVGFALGGMLILLSLSPGLAGEIVDIATPVVGACLLYVTSFMLVLAFRLLTAKAFDARKIFTLGIALSFGFCVDVMPELFSGAGTSTISDRLNLATILAIALSLIFRIGQPKTMKKS